MSCGKMRLVIDRDGDVSQVLYRNVKQINRIYASSHLYVQMIAAI